MTKTFDMDLVVTFADTNVAGNVYFARYVEWQGKCRELCLARYAPEFFAGMGGEHTAATVSCSCEYQAEFRLGNLARVEMSVKSARMNLMELSFEYYRIDRDHRTLMATGEQLTACVRRDGDHIEPAPWPREMLAMAQALGVDTR